MSQQHPDPITEGFLHGGQRLVQIVTVAVGAQQALARRTERLRAAEQARDLATQSAEAKARRAALAEAASHWARAHDRKWLRQAPLLNVAEAWGAAVPYASDNASAATAVRKCEERLRDLHPHAMSHYDRFREKGMEALDAMKQAAPFFTRAPNVRTGDPATPRGELREGTGAAWAATEHGPDRGEWEEVQLEQRARQIAERLSTALRSQGREPRPRDLRTVLEITTNLPEHIIMRAIPDRAPQSDGDRGPAAEDFPLPVDEALEMTSKQPYAASPPRRADTQTPDRNRRRNL
ncbi:hypothetical protein [Actinomadura roseirufa]|uniref:hypothetical protein n=1 Tax=Actinomadura roseirufa TaxID=2094049 RepID=UPI0010419FC3|nr:hypothetical protein [Actinomadura roseirufa]